MSKCSLIAPKLNQINNRAYAELSNLACISFLIAETDQYQYNDNQKKLLYLAKLSLETNNNLATSWHDVCKQIFHDSPNPELTPYKKDIDATLALIDKGCHKTAALICTPKTKAELYQMLDAAGAEYTEIKDYIEQSICGQDINNHPETVILAI